MDNSPSSHADNKKKDILILGKCTTDGFDYTTVAAEKVYSADITELCKKICLSLHDNGFNSHLFANSVKQYQFKGKVTEKIHILYVWVIFQNMLFLKT